MSASARRWFYLFSGVVAALVPIGIQLGLFDTGQGENFTVLLATIGSMLGAGGALTAARVTHKQIKEGMHDEMDPTEVVMRHLPRVLEDAATAQANVDRMRQVTDELLNGLSAGQSRQIGSLTQQALDRILK